MDRTRSDQCGHAARDSGAEHAEHLKGHTPERGRLALILRASLELDQDRAPDGAAHQKLNRVHRALVGLDHGDDRLVLGATPDLAQGDFGGAQAHSEAGAEVPAETDGVVDLVLAPPESV